jgi:hypothetical protein
LTISARALFDCCRVGIDMPTVEVRFQNLEAEAEVRVGSSGLPTVLNSVVNTLEVRKPASAPVSSCLSDSERRSILNFGRCASLFDAGSGERAALTAQ